MSSVRRGRPPGSFRMTRERVIALIPAIEEELERGWGFRPSEQDIADAVPSRSLTQNGHAKLIPDESYSASGTPPGRGLA